jgi:deferrochelatase/peroxidase EfeB
MGDSVTQRPLDLADIQGNLVRAYSRFGFPRARYFFLHIGETEAGREFVDALRRKVTTSAPWPTVEGTKRVPKVTLNVGFTFLGLLKLGLPTRTLQRFPSEFMDGMRSRAHILGDRNPALTEEEQPDWDRSWDPIWRTNRNTLNLGGLDDVHVWISMNAQVEPGTDRPVPELDAQTRWLESLCKDLDHKVHLFETNGRLGDQKWQDASALFAKLPNGMKIPTPTEHFGLADGIGNPVYAGQFELEEERERVRGRGKWMNAEQGWQPLATGEFLLGHPDESQELPPTAPPDAFTRNGSFMAYRKLHENVSSFREYFASRAEVFAKVMGVSESEAEATLKAKVVGRWPDGVPLARAATHAAWQELRRAQGMEHSDPLQAAQAQAAYLRSPAAIDFKFGGDMPGYDTPNASHIRRVNPRDYLDPESDPSAFGAHRNPDSTTQLNNRRRILRRGLPYGASSVEAGSDDTEQGVVFMAVCASLFRQFEFIQQQWVQYGLDFNVGNSTCPLVGDHTSHQRYVIPADPTSGKPPFICTGLRNFVETRGGDYFFLPSLSALRVIAMGIVDPT